MADDEALLMIVQVDSISPLGLIHNDCDVSLRALDVSILQFNLVDVLLVVRILQKQEVGFFFGLELDTWQSFTARVDGLSIQGGLQEVLLVKRLSVITVIIDVLRRELHVDNVTWSKLILGGLWIVAHLAESIPQGLLIS